MADFENRLLTDYANFGSDMDYLKNVTTASLATIKDFDRRLNLTSERQSDVKQKIKSITHSMAKRFEAMNKNYDRIKAKLKAAEVAGYVNIAVSAVGLVLFPPIGFLSAITTGAISAIMMRQAQDDVKYLKNARVRITCIEIKDLNIN